AARRSHAATRAAADDRDRLSGPNRSDGLKMTAIFVADWKSVEKVLAGQEADAFEIGRTTRTNPLKVLQRRRQPIAARCHRLSNSGRSARRATERSWRGQPPPESRGYERARQT